MKPRIAIVVQRWAADMVGGSEALAWQYAELLGEDFDVELLTSTALDYVTWANALPEGVERVGDITVRRFATAFTRSEYFFTLDRKLRADWPDAANVSRRAATLWTTALQEEVIKFQGPWCPGLLAHLDEHADVYAAVLLCTYLYPTSYFVSCRVDPRKLLMVPTLHDEPMAHLHVFQRYRERIARFLWLTEAERQLATRLWGVTEGEVIGMTVDAVQAKPESMPDPYLVYSGRIDVMKGCDQMLDWFARYRAARPESRLRLVLTGKDTIGLRKTPHVEFLGFVSEERKLSLMAGALAFIHPSRYESFSIVALEAMAQGTPILVNGDCEPLVEHVRNSGNGRTYRSYVELEIALDALLGADRETRDNESRLGRRYVAERYARAAVRERLAAEVRAVVRAAADAPESR